MDPHAQDLVAGWLLDDGSGFRARDFVGKNHCVLTGFADPSTAASGWNPGRYGKTPVFDGANDHMNRVDTTNSALDFNDGEPISIAIGGLLHTVASNQTLLTKGRTGADETNYTLRSEGGRLTFYYRNTGDGWEIFRSSAIIFTANVPYDIVVTNVFGGGSVVRMYVNGVEYAGGWISGDGTGAPYVNNNSFQIGAINSGGGEQWDGPIDYMYIYKRVLLRSTAQELHMRPFQMFVSPFWAWLSSVVGPPAGIEIFRRRIEGY